MTEAECWVVKKGDRWESRPFFERKHAEQYARDYFANTYASGLTTIVKVRVAEVAAAS